MRNKFYIVLSWFTLPFLWFYRNRLRVLAYHTVNNPTNFEKQLNYISTHFTVITPIELKEHLYHNKKLLKNAVLITFDDGDSTVLENGLPLLEKYNFPATLFVITELVGTSKPFWWYEMEQLLDKSSANSKVWEVKKIPNAERVAYLDEIRNKNQRKITQRQLTLEELKLMQSKNITIANHSHTHPMFDKSTSEELDFEMQMTSNYLLENGFEHELFAYPNGNYDLESEKILKKHGIKFAFLFDHFINAKNINPLRISRIRVNTEDNLNEFKTKVTGQHSLIMNFNKK
jgi:peptidoglycan/xylan/chitin deacetylase (PgdA/CDA1 family)